MCKLWINLPALASVPLFCLEVPVVPNLHSATGLTVYQGNTKAMTIYQGNTPKIQWVAWSCLHVGVRWMGYAPSVLDQMCDEMLKIIGKNGDFPPLHMAVFCLVPFSSSLFLKRTSQLCLSICFFPGTPQKPHKLKRETSQATRNPTKPNQPSTPPNIFHLEKKIQPSPPGVPLKQALHTSTSTPLSRFLSKQPGAPGRWEA